MVFFRRQCNAYPIGFPLLPLIHAPET